MRGRITSNAGELARRMQQRKAAVLRELSREAVAIKNELVAESRRILKEEIYDQEIPFRKSVGEAVRQKYGGTSRQKVGGKQIRQWQRSGDLLREERGRTDGPVVILLNTKHYAGPRYRLGTSKGQKIKSEGVRSVQWQGEAIRRKRSVILQRRRQAVLRALLKK